MFSIDLVRRRSMNLFSVSLNFPLHRSVIGLFNGIDLDRRHVPLLMCSKHFREDHQGSPKQKAHAF